MQVFPYISHAQVAAVDPIRGFVYVQFPSLQMPGLRARLLYHGAADGLRIKQTAMPTIGTWGLVLCPYNDSRHAIWAGSILTSFLDARTGDGDPYTEYHSHWSGYFDHLDGLGNFHRYFPDGSYEAFASSTALPAITRHTVDDMQAQQTTAFPASERVSSTVAARPYLFHHASGTTRSVTAAGSVAEAVTAGQSHTVTANGTTVEVDTTGNASVTAAAGQTITLTANGSTFVIDQSGNIQMSLANGAKWDVKSGGSSSDFLVLASKLVAIFNAHTHGNVQNGGGTTAVPTTLINSAEISSSLIGVQD